MDNKNNRANNKNSNIRKKILIIDDEIDLVELIKTRLELHDYYVVPCYTSKRGLEIVRREKPDLILLDIMMPDLNGYEVYEILKKHRQTNKIPVVLFTANHQEAKLIEDKCVQLGATDYILKPFETKELLDKIKRLI